MNKEGLLLAETTVKVIIALIGISVLVVLGWKLAGIIIDDQAFKTSEIHMEAIEEIILELEENEGGEREYILLNPKGWTLIGWPSDLQGYTASSHHSLVLLPQQPLLRNQEKESQDN